MKNVIMLYYMTIYKIVNILCRLQRARARVCRYIHTDRQFDEIFKTILAELDLSFRVVVYLFFNLKYALYVCTRNG